MSVPYSPAPDERELHQRVCDLTSKAARPLVRYDDCEPWPKVLSGGSCFILRFETGLVGVTANHVLAAFEEDRQQNPGIRFLLRTAPIDLFGAIIARDADLDIATFSVTEDTLRESEGLALDCRAEWPPPVPVKGHALSFCGFPTTFAKRSLHSNIEFREYANLTLVQDVTPRDIIVTYEPTRDSRVVASPGYPELGLNLSGCSGGPTLLHISRSGLHRWFPVGMMIEGPRDQGKGMAAEFDMIRLRRIHFIQPGGTIAHASSGA